MRPQCLMFFFLTALAICQSTAPAVTNAFGQNSEKSVLKDKAASPTVGPDEPVITLNDFCPDTAQRGEACKTLITRAQFEKLTEALQPGMPLSMRLKVAYNYARINRMAIEAEKRGLDKTAAFSEEMRYARMQLLSQDLSRALEEQANNVSPTEVEDYYKQNQSSFEQATFARIFIPHSRRSPAAHNDNAASPNSQSDIGEPAQLAGTDETAMAKLAIEVRSRAVHGEDPDQLQAEVYSAAGISGNAPKTKMENVRRTSLPPTHEMVMSLKPGEVSEVVSDPDGAHFIYKMISKDTLPLEQVNKEIRDQISSQRYKESMKKFQGDAIFSDAYFAPPEQHAAPHHNRAR